MKAKEILISGALVYKKNDSKTLWFIVRQNESDGWEIPKTTVRRGESSVRASIRMTGEQGGMRARMLEEVGRSAGSTTVSGRMVPQRYIYYLMVQKGESEVLGFAQAEWMEYKKAMSKLSSKREQNMLEKAREIAKEVQKQKRKDEEDELEEELLLNEHEQE